MAVKWRGVRVDPRTRDMLEEVALLTPTLPVLAPSQGSYNTSVGASAGTHAGGGAVDIRCSNLTAAQAVEVVRIMRTVGFAAWRRMPHEGPWPEHIHAVAVDCPDMSPAAARQIAGRNADGQPIGLRNGRNGLANNGPDPHRNLGLPVVTWEQYQQSRNERAVRLRDNKAPDWKAANAGLFGDPKGRTWENTPLKRSNTLPGAGGKLKNVAWVLRTIFHHVARVRAMVEQLLAGQAEAQAERAAQRELLVQLAGRSYGVELTDAQVRELADRIAAESEATGGTVLDRLEAAGRELAALTEADDEDDAE